MKLVYSGLIFCDVQGFTIEKSALRKAKKPVINEVIQFNHNFFNISISLIRIDDAIKKTLFKDRDNNELIWNCHHPRAMAEITYNGNIFKGYGYAETLFCKIKPWNLPIDELKWGRFLSDSFTVIWIKWIGKHPINKIFINGIEYNDAIFENDIIVFGDGLYQLKFSDRRIIRKGKLSGLFLKMTLLKMFLNRRILNTIEIKLKARTTLSINSVFLSNGWSLFEVVTWAK